MTDKEMQLAAAFSVGWKLSETTDRFGNRFYERNGNARNGEWRRVGEFPQTYKPLPGYDTLAEVAELEENLTLEEKGEYVMILGRVVDLGKAVDNTKGSGNHNFDLVHATGPQRREAYLIVKGLYKS